jgi:hypothetical protein
MAVKEAVVAADNLPRLHLEKALEKVVVYIPSLLLVSAFLFDLFRSFRSFLRPL